MPPPESSLPVAHVYAHFPFCASRCPYCAFNSYAGRNAEIDDYLEALLVEARQHLHGRGVATLYIGGGTPTLCDAARLERYVAGLGEAAGGVTSEFTVEANPGTLDGAKVVAMRRAGVDRVSLGAQSFDPRHLRTLGRVHDVAAIARGVDLLRTGGVERLSLDLILAVPGQTLEEQSRDLARAVQLGPEHVSTYVLTIEDDTVFARRVRNGDMPRPDDEREGAHLHLAIVQLEAAGYARYEISNFARGGAESQHNLAYWRDRDWIGLGAGAHSHVGMRRWKNVDDPAGYVRAVRAHGEAVAWVETAPPPVALFEALMMGLRLVEGVDLDALAERTGLDLCLTHGREIEAHLRRGLLRLEGRRLRPTPRGLDLASWVLRDLVPEVEVMREDIRTE